jgi:hypothetical protein
VNFCKNLTTFAVTMSSIVTKCATFVLLTLVFFCCFEGLTAVNQRCKACKRKHPPPRGRDCPSVVPAAAQEAPEHCLPRGRDCPFVDPAVAPEAQGLETFPTCRTCTHRHPSPRGRRCEVLAFDEDLPDPLRGNPAEHQEQDSLSGLNTQNVLLERLANQLSEMNANVLEMNNRVVMLENAAASRVQTPPRPRRVETPPRPRRVETPPRPHRVETTPRPAGQHLEGGMRARMQALNLNVNVSDDDEWEVAGAGPAPPQGKQLKSGALIPAQHDVLVQLDYPHKHVMRGAGRTAPLALNLTLPEFIFGYTEMMDSSHIDPAIRSHMMRFLKLLMEDTNVRPWASVRHYHMTIIQAMEAGQLSWGDTEQMLAIQRQHARTGAPVAVSTPRRISTPTRAANGVATPLYCSQYQTNACERATDHDSPRGFLHHCCAYCLRVTGRTISSHGESECRRKKAADEAKNSSQA